MDRIIRFFSLFRPHNILAAFLAVAVGYSMNIHQGYPWILLIAVSIAAAAGNVINDYYDRDIDRINKPARPIPAGVISPGGSLYIYIILLFSLAVIIFFLSFVQAVWLICWAVMLHSYSMRFKRKPVTGNLLVSVLTSSGFLLGSYSSGDIWSGVIPAIYTFLFIFAREIVKDCEDFDGDYIFGSRTLAILIGEERLMKAASVIFLILAVMFPLPFFFGIYSEAYFIIVIITVVPITLLSAFLSFRNTGAGLISLILKVGIFSGIVGFYYAV